MSRVQSSIRHDYKPAERVRSPSRKLIWFSAGLGVPLLGLLLALTLDGKPERPLRNAAEAHTFDIKAVPLSLHAPPQEVPVPAEESAPQDEDAAARATQRIALTVASGDSLDRLFVKHGLSRGDLARMLKVPLARDNLKLLRPGDELKLTVDGEQVLALSRELDESRRLEIWMDGERYDARIETTPLERRFRYARGEISTSLFEAGKDAGISDALIMKLAGIFAWDIDFVLDIRVGDQFLVLYEEVWKDGEPLRDGEILAAEFVNAGRAHRAVRFTHPDGRADYYTPDGLSMRKAFIRAPVDFTRISSNFNPKRLHPILKTNRPHRGVDYAAPQGTAIKAAGDGKVIFRGKKGGYGNAVILQHGGNITTLYAHMSRFARDIRVGSRVRQGQTIGFVGATGLATAPHLHYEYRVSGVHRNPRTVKLPQAEPIPQGERQAFLKTSGALLSQLDLVKRSGVSARPLEGP